MYTSITACLRSRLIHCISIQPKSNLNEWVTHGFSVLLVCNSRSAAIAWHELEKDPSVPTDTHQTIEEMFDAILYAVRDEAAMNTPAG